uniref:Ribonuclease E n=1 Tax=Porolithon onkodes TaxID=231751 RepID=A0A2Z2L5G9_9FLOR|nr:ribonuclease E [Porolithon onkodes]ASB29630.1 ribonuclease E [Porolithon onkodes]
MSKKIVISSFNNTAAILSNSKIQEFFSVNLNYQVNDIYLGVVHKIFNSINAAFIDLGIEKKSGFIHLKDIKGLKKYNKCSQIADVLFVNQLLIVQIVKEPTLNKGPRLTTNINLFGRYLVLMPFSNTINISHKIYDKNERSYLHALAVLLKPAAMGLLVRSSASGVKEATLVDDLRLLKKQWYFIQKLAIISSSPSLIYKDEDLVQKVVRDLYHKGIYTIFTDSSKILKRLRYYLNRWSCLSINADTKLKLLKKTECILDKFNINATIINALKPKVNLTIGGYLFIETYEAFTIIDVNSGSFNKANNSKETVLRANCYAATEIAYQMKIRNINGIIIVDFIDMDSYRDQLQLLEHFARVLSFDHAKPQIIQLSKLGLVELTRRRRKQSLFEFFYQEHNSNFTFTSRHMFFSDPLITKKKELIYRSVKDLFFSTFYDQVFYFYKVLIYNQYWLDTANLRPINSSNICDVFIVPLTLYSQVVRFSLLK